MSTDDKELTDRALANHAQFAFPDLALTRTKLGPPYPEWCQGLEEGDQDKEACGLANPTIGCTTSSPGRIWRIVNIFIADSRSPRQSWTESYLAI